jgi:hypothetical protein
MKYLPHSLVLCVGVLSLGGCPGGDDDDDTGRDRGDADGGVDDHEVAGKGAAGKGGGTAGKASSDGGKGGVTADQAAAGACKMMGETTTTGVGGTQCTGIEEYTKCADDKCGSGDCYDGDCKDLLECYEGASDPCKADCKASSDCNDCLADVARCAADECIELVMCGETKAGGACDKLDECCEARSDSAKNACKSAASSSRSGGGDELCMTVLTSLCRD